MQPFEEPDETTSGSTRLNPKEIEGHLLMVWPVDYIPFSQTRYTKPDKPSDVIVVDIVDLDLADENGYQGLLARKSWWRQGQLIGSLKNKIGIVRPILARMGRGAASPGFTPPYELHTANGDVAAVSRANGWLMAHPDFKPSTPDQFPQQQYSQGDPWAGMGPTSPTPPPTYYQAPPPQRPQPTYQSPPQYQQPPPAPVPPPQQYQQPMAHPQAPPPQQPAPQQPQGSMMERMAAQAKAGAQRIAQARQNPPLPPPPPPVPGQEEQIPY